MHIKCLGEPFCFDFFETEFTCNKKPRHNLKHAHVLAKAATQMVQTRGQPIATPTLSSSVAGFANT